VSNSRSCVRALSICLAWTVSSILVLVWPNSYLAQAPASAHVPTEVAWTEDAIASASGGDPVRGLLIARRCDRCHGSEGFSAAGAVPNLAAMDRLSFWKQMEDFRSGHRGSSLMEPVAAALSSRDFADLAAYYSVLPDTPDPLASHAFPQSSPPPGHAGLAVRLITLGDGQRGVPPCQACHGPVARVLGAPSLMTQNADYILAQLNAFAGGTRANDINLRMRSIAGQLTDIEKQAIAEYYGAGFGKH